MERQTALERIRWKGYVVIFGGVLVHLTLGTVYTFGNMTPYMTSYFRTKGISPDLSYEDSVWIFALATMGQGASLFIGGILIRKIGPKLTTLLGAWMSSIGVLLTYFTIQHSFALTLLTYGVMFGFGVGIAYTIPMACAMKWLPERKGLVNGLVVAGFGGGAFIFDQIQTAFLNPENKVADQGTGSEKYFDQLDILDRVPTCFLLLGGCYAGIQLLGILLLMEPSEGRDSEREPLLPNEDIYQSEPKDTESLSGLHNPSQGGANEDALYSLPSKTELSTDRSFHQLDQSSETLHKPNNISQMAVNQRTVEQSLLEDIESKTPRQVLKDKLFYILWFIYLFNGQGISFISTLYKAYGQTFIKDDHFLAIVGSLAAVCNGCGRIMWGVLADRFSVRSALVFHTGIFCILMLTLEVTSLVGRGLFTLYVCLLFLSFSGNFALLPTATARTFGQKYYGINYGMVFTASVITAPIAAILTSNLKSSIGWSGLFFMVAGFSFMSMCLSWSFKAKRTRS